uniref:Uncharacterized protein n=1 Tax=Tetranychus urticae TaxID=32264 RepID=T1KX68_TETUR
MELTFTNHKETAMAHLVKIMTNPQSIHNMAPLLSSNYQAKQSEI